MRREQRGLLAPRLAIQLPEADGRVLAGSREPLPITTPGQGDQAGWVGLDRAQTA
jgi:hypothetical protein